MGKAIVRVAVLIMALVLGFSATGLAAADDSPGEADGLVKVLAIDAPGVVRVGEMVAIEVSDRATGAPVGNASVYALSWRWAGVSNTDSAFGTPWYTCVFVGKTGSGGNVSYIFERPGRFLLVATKDDWGPGLAWMTVKSSVEGRLGIKAPPRAPVDEPVSMKVLNTNSGEAVFEADMWAIRLPTPAAAETAPSVGDLRAMLQELKEGDTEDIAGVLSAYGFPLGQTGTDGVLEYTFGEEGRYLLVATKSGYVPGFRPISIIADIHLAIRGPRYAQIEEVVTFRAVTRVMGRPVEGAALYALRWPTAEPLSLPLLNRGGDGSWLEELATESGEYLGLTNAEGEFEHGFSQEGLYAIVGIKDGYMPGATLITIGEFKGLTRSKPQVGPAGCKRVEGEGSQQTLGRPCQLRERVGGCDWE
jgi:hypothetical protein